MPESIKVFLDNLMTKWKEMDKNNKLRLIEESLKKDEELQVLLSELFSYSSLRTSTNVNDYEAMGEMAKLQIALQDIVSSNVAFNKFLLDCDLDELSKESDLIKTYLFNLKKSKDQASHMLSDKEEVLASKLSMVGSNSWSDLQSQSTANLKVKVKGFKKTMNLSSVRNLAYSDSKEVRKNAYIAELKAYKQVEDAVAMALNNIKREVNIMMPLRKYNNALEKTLIQSNMKKETLDAMIGAIKEERENLIRYFKLKAKALGYKKGLPFYELFAPMGNLVKTYTIEEAKELVLKVYRSFSEPLYEMGKKAFEERWIDVLPHEGKVSKYS